ncbi:MAG: hypothetical protein WC969_06850 [Elusimicrobiota bacterium]|jgi:hypothetical protein
MADDSDDDIRVRSGDKDKDDRKAGGGLLPGSSGGGVALPGGGPAIAVRQVQPYMLRLANLNGGSWHGIARVYPKGFAGQFMRFLGSKAALGIVVGAAVSVSGFGMLDMGKRGGFGKVQAARRAAPFQSSYSPDQLKDVAGPSPAGPSALALAQKANSGLFAPPQAAGGDAAAPAPDAAAAAAEASSPEAAAAGQAPEQSLGAAQQSAAKMVAAPLGKFSQRGQLNGGAGMTSGIGGTFKQPVGNTQLAQAKAFNTASTGKVTRAPVAAVPRGSSSYKSATARRLDRMNRAMGPTKTGNAEAGSAVHTQEWSNAQPAGNALQGAGASSAISGGPDTSGEGTTGGTPIEQPGTTTPAQDAAPDVGDTENVTPWQKMVDGATVLLGLAALLTFIAYEGMVEAGLFLSMSVAMAEAIAMVAVAMSAMVTLIGVMLMAQGQMLQGAIFTATGGLSTYFAYQSLLADPEVAEESYKQIALASQIGGAVAGQLLKGKMK